MNIPFSLLFHYINLKKSNYLYIAPSIMFENSCALDLHLTIMRYQMKRRFMVYSKSYWSQQHGCMYNKI